MSGHSIATPEVLEFQLAHAQARDAVHAALDAERFALRLRNELPRLAEQGVEVLTLRSCAVDRASYLRHPQRGRSSSYRVGGRLEVDAMRFGNQHCGWIVGFSSGEECDSALGGAVAAIGGERLEDGTCNSGAARARGHL